MPAGFETWLECTRGDPAAANMSTHVRDKCTLRVLEVSLLNCKHERAQPTVGHYNRTWLDITSVILS